MKRGILPQMRIILNRPTEKLHCGRIWEEDSTSNPKIPHIGAMAAFSILALAAVAQCPDCWLAADGPDIVQSSTGDPVVLRGVGSAIGSCRRIT